ncbi:MAG: biopolymer transporter ExbD [Pirellulaceae bacterium]|nr:biopolymer transporter ExbD [Pirellulaceae bacterium]
MKRVLQKTSRRTDVDLAMTPLIDVVFLLLVFFVWTASFQVTEYVLPTELSTTSGSGNEQVTPDLSLDFEPIVIQLLWRDARPAYVVNNTLVDSLDDIEKMLHTIAGIQPDNPVIIDPEPAVPFGHVIQVYDQSRIAGFEQVQFATPEDA